MNIEATIFPSKDDRWAIERIALSYCKLRVLRFGWFLGSLILLLLLVFGLPLYGIHFVYRKLPTDIIQVTGRAVINANLQVYNNLRSGTRMAEIDHGRHREVSNKNFEIVIR